MGLKLRSLKRARPRHLIQQGGGPPKALVCMFSAPSSYQLKPHRLKCLVTFLICVANHIFIVKRVKSNCSGRHGLDTSVMILFRSFAILVGALLPIVYHKPANPWGTRLIWVCVPMCLVGVLLTAQPSVLFGSSGSMSISQAGIAVGTTQAAFAACHKICIRIFSLWVANEPNNRSQIGGCVSGHSHELSVCSLGNSVRLSCVW
ncbi:hypothetical protein ABBQ38_008475 [Trebouxia sp. C0009 RCD-2024]